MIFNLNDFLRATSRALDFIEEDLFGVPTNHSKRIALIALKLGKTFAMSEEELFDLASMSLLHDNGASLKILHDGLRGTSKEKLTLIENMQEHCCYGEDNVSSFPFLTMPVNVIKYHHEHYDGSGFFGIQGDSIPVMAQIIRVADQLDLTFNLPEVANFPEQRSNVVTYVQNHKGTSFSPVVSDAMLELANNNSFWQALTDENIDLTLSELTPDFYIEYSYQEIREITCTFSKMIDAKSKFTQLHSSGLANKLEEMAAYYEMNEDETQQLLIAADLHDLGKLAVSNRVLDKPGALSKAEYEDVKRHPEIAKKCLQEIKGFETITKWIYNHHEKLDGSGYPRAITGDQIDFHSRLLACMDIYQALREDRPYRVAMDHNNAMKVLQNMAVFHKLDQNIVNDIGVICSTLR